MHAITSLRARCMHARHRARNLSRPENAEVLVPELTGELTDEESEIILAKDLPDPPPKPVFVDEEGINTVTLHDDRNFVCKTCGMVFKREKRYENFSSSCSETAKKMPKLKKTSNTACLVPGN